MLDNVKPGDRVKSCLAGWGTVNNVFVKGHYPIQVEFDCERMGWFTINGRANINDLHSEIVEVAKKKWEPPVGNWCINQEGKIHCVKSSIVAEASAEEGRAYRTKEEAELAYYMIRKYQRLISYVLEQALDFPINEFYYGERNWTVLFNASEEEWKADCYRYYFSIETVFMPRDVAIELAEKLNSGEVEL